MTSFPIDLLSFIPVPLLYQHPYQFLMVQVVVRLWYNLLFYFVPCKPLYINVYLMRYKWYSILIIVDRVSIFYSEFFILRWTYLHTLVPFCRALFLYIPIFSNCFVNLGCDNSFRLSLKQKFRYSS